MEPLGPTSHFSRLRNWSPIFCAWSAQPFATWCASWSGDHHAFSLSRWRDISLNQQRSLIRWGRRLNTITAASLISPPPPQLLILSTDLDVGVISITLILIRRDKQMELRWFARECYLYRGCYDRVSKWCLSLSTLAPYVSISRMHQKIRGADRDRLYRRQ